MHHAAINGHMNCVTFLVSFGSNIWTLDNDFHTPLDVAGLTGCKDIVAYLDTVVSKQSALNQKIVKKLKERALIDAQKRIKRYHKLQEKAQKKAEKVDKALENETVGIQESYSAPPALHSNSYGTNKFSKYSVSSKSLRSNFSEPKPYSAHFSTSMMESTTYKKFTISAVAKRIKQRKDINCDQFGGDFKVCQTEMDGTKTIRSLSGLKRDHHVLYMKAQHRKESDSSGSSREDDVFLRKDDAFSRAISEPDLNYNGDSGLGSNNSTPPESAGIFERPGFGSVAFITRRLANGTFVNLPSEEEELLESDCSQKKQHPQLKTTTGNQHNRHLSNTDSIGTLGSLAVRIKTGDKNHQKDLPWEEDDLATLDDDDIGDSSPLELFLAANTLTRFIPLFTREKVDLQALMLLTEADLCELGLEMGPRKKLLAAAEKRKAILKKPGAVTDTLL